MLRDPIEGHGSLYRRGLTKASVTDRKSKQIARSHTAHWRAARSGADMHKRVMMEGKRRKGMSASGVYKTRWEL